MGSITPGTSFIAPPATVLVTGANGYIATHVVAVLLKRGYTVVGTVRMPSKRDLVLRMHGANPNLSVVVVDDISKSVSYLTALSSIGAHPAAIIHLAAPFSYAVSNYEDDLLIPAVAGTAAILEAAQALQSAGLRRVVHTNSFACIYDAALGPRPGYTYTERDWSPLSYADGVAAGDAPTAYRAAKAVAEKSAFEFVEARGHEVSFDLVSLCPAMVFGPYLNAEAMPARIEELGESLKLVWNVISAGREAAVPATKGPVWVDVRDVAEAHVRALEERRAGGERYLLAAGTYCNQEIADEVRRVGLAAKSVPTGTPGARDNDKHFGIDGGKARKELGMEWTSLQLSLADLVPQLSSIAGSPSI